MDLLMEKLESPHQDVNQITESRMACEKCGNTGHSGKCCPFTQEDENSIGNDTPNDSDGIGIYVVLKERCYSY